MKNIDSRNVGIRDGNVEDRDESTGGISCTVKILVKLVQGILTKEKI